MKPSGLVRHLAITTLVLALVPTSAFARSLWVSTSGEAPCMHSLQAAIDAAQISREEDVIFLVGSGPFIGPFSILEGGITIVGGVPKCGATTSTQYATLLAPSGQRPLSILLDEDRQIILQRLVITTKSGTLKGTGGGIWFAGPNSLSQLVLDDSQVVANNSLSDGGGIFVSGGTVQLIGGSIVSSNTAVNGGGIAGVNGAVIRIDQGIVAANTAWYDGGGIHAPDAHAWIGEGGSAGLLAAVANNIAGNAGGGIYVGADASPALLGWATPAEITGNQARRGGGIFLDDAAMVLYKAEINHNTASEEGGGIYVTSGAEIAGIATSPGVPLFDGFPRFIDNQAGEGAALYADGALTEIDLGSGSFLHHDTSAEGAAVVAVGGNARLSIRGITVSLNQAPELFAVEGGAALTLRHVSIAGNDVNRLVRWDGSSPGVQVAASAFSETEPFFSGLPTPQVLPQLTCIVSHSPFLLEGMPPGTDLSQVAVADPRFVAPERGDLHAWPGSPVVDLCTAAGNGLDRDGNVRGFDEPFRLTPEGQTHDAGADEVVAIAWDDFESGTLSHWTGVDPPVPGSGNSVQITAAARLGPPTSQHGLQLTLVDPSVQTANPVVLWAIPEQNTRPQTRLNGSFFIDPQGFTMSTAAGLNRLRLITLREGNGGASPPRLDFALKRTAADTWFLEVRFWPDLGAPIVAGSAFFACAGMPCGNPADWRNNRIEFAWRGEDPDEPGHLTMWRTRYLNGVPAGRVQMLSVDLPIPGAVINEVDLGFGFGEQPAGSFGQIYLDEVSFTR